MQTLEPFRPIVAPRHRTGTQMMKLPDLTDESLLAYYESVRRQVLADDRLGSRHRLAGATMKQYAESLRNEMVRRRLQFKPIVWSSS